VRRLALRRLALLVPTLLGVATLVFAFLHLIPGDPVEIMLGESAGPADVAALRRDPASTARSSPSTDASSRTRRAAISAARSSTVRRCRA
jgi:ABC-type microcin C transport system permease subunit YejB